MYFNSMYYIVYFLFLIISLTNAQSSLISNLLCAQYYPYDVQQQQCECEDIATKGISLKCIGHSYVPHFLPNIQYHVIELESCSQDLQIGDKTFADLNINTLRLRHCNLIGLNEESFSKINHLEKFIIENSTINSLTTSSGNFQDIFYSDSFKTLKLLTLKNIHYHQLHKHDKKLNLELLLNQLQQLNRLELSNIHIDNYHYHNLTSIGQNLTYLKLINTHQTSLLPIERLKSLERLILLHLPKIFETQSLISSIKKLKHLKYIDFGHNRLTHINDLQSNTIDQIDLTSNLIEFIDEYTFEHLPKLQALTLTGNPLKYIDKNAFCGIENLERLYIKDPKTNEISPLDNCILLSHPNLDIKQENQAKFQCNCQLWHIYQLQKKHKKEINRLFTLNHVCIVTNNTLLQSNYYQQLKNHLNSPLYINELVNYLNCSLNDQCDRLCQERKIKTTLPPIQTQKTNVIIQKKHTSLSTSLYSFFSYILFLLLLAFLYL
ncbi:unnamed protein product [Rotaria sordida]|uniref:Uncharacterized protein n=1 Tax=Rotaria sordida TaxID=392033 RepID=A0A813NJT0_9BILA|nr:unnamed protein product [Rotaria sordida]CAF0770564.1 unnamed protein product [Rotaria sordida]CAF0773673.1 unnamed protein product [Rotaria sordida]CAF0788847.1 unnamed protein product [Rotaria sordida]CAF0839289.1 unnamed protein product [Rotaria sordida]